jgi:hypothetical protein
MKSHMLLLQGMLTDVGIRCRTSTTLDWKTIQRRTEYEGLSFLTITLPSFCDDLQKGLAQEMVDSTLFVSFAKSGHLPHLFGGFVSQIFDRKTGLLLNSPSTDAIHAVRQICLAYSKVLLPCTKARENAAVNSYIQCEKEVRESDKRLSSNNMDEFRRISFLLVGNVFSKVDREIYDGSTIVPKHGPGCTADGLIGNGKYRLTQWTRRLEEGYFPHGEFLFPSWSHFLDSPTTDILEPGQELPVKITLVPKTLKTPRVIAIEPTCMMYTQQAIMECLVANVERDDILSKFLGFSDQIPNQEMARVGSLDGSLATLDLKEASDRVSNQLVRYLAEPWPHLFGALDSTRSRRAVIPGRSASQRLAKYASMGSALCFPIEATIFLIIAFMGIQNTQRRPLTRKGIESLIGQVRVYGDDIIVPVEYVHTVVEELEAFGLRVNLGKSFWTGKFRESCGREYYSGQDVSIVKVRRMLPTQRQDVSEIVSAVSLRNQLYYAGFKRSVEILDLLIESLIPFPWVSPQSPVLGKHDFLGSFDSQKLCSNLHTPLVRGYVVSSRSPINSIDGSAALLKFFLKRGDKPFADRDHLERSGRPRHVDIKLRWAPST